MSEIAKKKIVLSMICKNETHIIKECFDSLYKFIDYWVICDTGSTDGTQELITEYFKEKGIPGELHQHEWVDFATNRTAAMKLCDGKGDLAWMIDADDYLVGEMNFPHHLNFDGYSIRIKRGNFEWWRNQIFKTGIGWVYEGVLHEYAHCPNKPDLTLAKLDMPGYHVEARTEGGARNKGITPTEKYSKDAVVLEQALEKEPLNSRYQFYLAQSYFDSQQWDKSFEAYEKRAKMGIYRMNGYPRIGYLFAKQGLSIPMPLYDILFISQDVYQWQLLDEIASCAYYVHQFQEGYDASVKLIQEGLAPPSEIQRIQSNLGEYQNKINELKTNQAAIAAHQQKMAAPVVSTAQSVPNIRKTPNLPIPNQTTLSISEPKYKKKFKDRVKG